MVFSSFLIDRCDAAKSRQWIDCEGGKDISFERQILGCTDVIVSGVESSSNLAVAFGNRANARGRTGDNNAALNDYDQSLKLNPNNSLVLSNRGNAFFRMKRYDDALTDLNKAVSIKTDYAYAYGRIGDVLVALDRFPEAVEKYEKAIAIEPKNPTYLVDRGWVYIKQWDSSFITIEDRVDAIAKGGPIKADLDQAFEDFSQAIRLAPDSVYALNARCYANILRKLYAPAISDCGASISKERSLAYPWRWRAYAYFRSGNHDSAVDDINEAVRLSPDSAAFRNMKANILRARGKPGDKEKAVDIYTEALQIEPDDPVKLTNRGRTYRDLGNHQRAVADFSQALALKPDYIEALIARTGAYRDMGETAKAEQDAISAALLRDKQKEPSLAPR